LCSAPWPGNVRQLENAVERAVLLASGPRIEPGDLGNELARAMLQSGAGAGPPAGAGLYRAPMTLKRALQGPERRILVEALELNGWSRQRTAAMLGINRTTLFNKMRKHDLLDGAPERAPSDEGPS
jgi:DNA-binding NtrC family response regulator